MAGGGWRVAGGEWRVAGGEWRVSQKMVPSLPCPSKLMSKIFLENLQNFYKIPCFFKQCIFFLIKQNFCLNCFSRHNNSYYHRLKIDKMLCNFFNFCSEKFGGFPSLPQKYVASGEWRVAGGGCRVASGAVPFGLIPTR